jgi:hypothetical protein
MNRQRSLPKPPSASAVEALADANPFLRRVDGVPAGTVLDVPPFDGADVRPAATERRAQ